MFSHIQVSSDGTLLIYANQRGSARTASFARGTITLDIIGGTLQFKNYELLPIPKGVSYVPGTIFFLGLMDEHGYQARSRFRSRRRGKRCRPAFVSRARAYGCSKALALRRPGDRVSRVA